MKEQRKTYSKYFSQSTTNSILTSNLPIDRESGLFLQSESNKVISNLNNISKMNSTHIPKIDLKNSTIPKLKGIANMKTMNINNLNI